MNHRPYHHYVLCVDKMLNSIQATDPTKAVKLALLCNGAVRAKFGLKTVVKLTERDEWDAVSVAHETLKTVGVVPRNKQLSNVGCLVHVRV